MKKKQKTIFDDITVDVIPKGKESKYYTKEQSFELIKRFKQPIKILLVFYLLFFIMMILTILKRNWFSILIYVFVVLVLVSIITGIVMYKKFIKYVKEISKEENPNISE